jgi:hypothetical protein
VTTKSRYQLVRDLETDVILGLSRGEDEGGAEVDSRVVLLLLSFVEWEDARGGLQSYVEADGDRDIRLVRFKRATRDLAAELEATLWR